MSSRTVRRCNFALGDQMTRAQFDAALAVLVSRDATPVSRDTVESHWSALEQRWTGTRRWDAVVPREDLQMVMSLKSREAYLTYLTTLLLADSLAIRSGYVAPVVDGVRYTIDYFNPANELKMPYQGAGEPVLALLLQNAASGPGKPNLVRDQLPASFYDILRELYCALTPGRICGNHSIYSLMAAYDDGRANPAISPWSFLHKIQLLREPPIPIDGSTEFDLDPENPRARQRFPLGFVEQYEPGRVLIKARPGGLDGMMAPEEIVVAKALGMHSIIELVEGSVW